MKKYYCLYFLVITYIGCSQNVAKENYQVVCGRNTTNRLYLFGSVYEDQGKRIERDFFGASILIKGTKIGTQAGKDGKYCLDITSLGDTIKKFIIICQFIGYERKEVVVKKRKKKNTELNFKMVRGPAKDDVLQVDQKNFNQQTK